MDCEEDDDRAAALEIDAAEALAELRLSSAAVNGSMERRRLERNVDESPSVITSTHSVDQVLETTFQQFSGNISAKATCSSKTTENADPIPCQLGCRTSGCQSKIATRLRPNLTEAEKEERRIRRIFANRESARQTIRRRQMVYDELTKKAAELSENNTLLKKEKELAVKEYNSLKERNEFLKAEIAKRKKPEPGKNIQEETNSFHSEIPATTNIPPPYYICDNPPFVPFFWPSHIPSSDTFQFPTHPIEKTPFFILPAPWLFPYLTHREHEATSQTHKCPNCSCSASQENHYHNTRGEPSIRSTDQGPWFNGNMQNVNLLGKKRGPSICPLERSEDEIASSEARRKRRELIQLREDEIASTEARRKRRELMQSRK